MLRYISNRDLALVSTIKETLTVEDYCKWYNLFYIKGIGNIEVVPFVGDDYTIDGVDHYVYPSSVVEYCLKTDRKIDYISYLAICYRYMEDAGGPIPETFLPAREDLEKVLITDVYDENIGFSHCDYHCLYPQHIKPEYVLEGYTK